MDQEIKRQWVEALRSGDYEQGFGYLRKPRTKEDAPDQFCCLGVLCEIAVQAGVVDEASTAIDGVGGPRVYYYDDEEMTLPSSVMRWAGLNSNAPEVMETRASGEHYVDGVRALTDINDDGRTFEDIADMIEESL